MAASSQHSAQQPKMIQWLIDTRPLWPVPPKSKPREEVEQLKIVASRALSLLAPTEQASVLRFYHLKDAKMSLASHLLKHLIITKYASIPWSQSTISRDAHGKPCYLPASGTYFNVSHQAGIVSLIAVVQVGKNDKIDVGTDVVCWNERLMQDYAHIEKDGFFQWVDMHADVFAKNDVSHMKLAPVSIDNPGSLSGFAKDAISRCQWRNQEIRIKVQGNDGGNAEFVDSNTVIDAKLRRFYAFWCLREAYVKMTGEALLAPWLKELEISDIKAPIAKQGHRESLQVGETVRSFTIHLKGERVINVGIELVALGEEFMVGVAVRPMDRLMELGLNLGTWEWLDLERDILAFAESKL